MPIRNGNNDIYSDIFFQYLNENEEKIIDEAASKLENTIQFFILKLFQQKF